MMEILKDILKYIGWIILGFVAFCLFITFAVFPWCNNCYSGEKIYEYKDLDGNIGTATHCQFSDASNHFRKGGQGQPICFNGKRIVAVKWYEDKTKYENCFKSIFKEDK